MALLFIDGFDYYLAGDLAARYDGGSAAGMDSGRSGLADTQAVRLGQNGAVTRLLPGGAKGKVIAGIAARCLVQWEQVWDGILVFKSGDVVQVRIDVDPTTGEVRAYRGDGAALLGSASSPPRGDAWHHVAAEVTASSSNGRVRVAIDGGILIDVGSANTDPAGSGAIDRVGFTAEGSGNPAAYTDFDDYYLADGPGGAGDKLEDFGDLWVGTHYPNSDVDAAWSRSGGDTNCGNVDEPQEDGDATYNYSATAQATDLYGCPAITEPAAGSVVGVQVSGVVRKSGPGARIFALLLRSGAVESEGSATAPDEGYQVYSHLVPSNQDGGGSWSLAAAGAGKIGIRVKA